MSTSVRSLIRVCAITGFALGALDGAATAADISACGARIENETGVLVADLDCPGSTIAIVIGERGTLQMNGHRISGADMCISASSVTKVARHATIVGPGEVSGCRVGLSIAVNKAQISDLDVHDNTEIGIRSEKSRASLKATNVSVHDNGDSGFYGGNLDLENVTASANADSGIEAIRLRGSGVTTNGNADYGVVAVGFARLTALQANANGLFGIAATKRLRLTDSTLTGNTNADILSVVRPLVKNVTCDHSSDPIHAKTWGICTGD